MAIHKRKRKDGDEYYMLDFRDQDGIRVREAVYGTLTDAKDMLRQRKQEGRQFNFRLTEQEYRLVEEAAGGYPPATWARVELLKIAAKAVKKGGGS